MTVHHMESVKTEHVSVPVDSVEMTVPPNYVQKTAWEMEFATPKQEFALAIQAGATQIAQSRNVQIAVLNREHAQMAFEPVYLHSQEMIVHSKFVQVNAITEDHVPMEFALVIQDIQELIVPFKHVPIIVLEREIVWLDIANAKMIIQA